MGGTWVPIPSICDRKLPVCLWVLQGWFVRQLDRWRGSQSDSYLPLGWLVLPGVWWSWHVACGVSQPGGSPGLSIPDGCGAHGFGFLDGVGAGGLGLLYSCRWEGLSIQGGKGADGSGFFDGLCCLKLFWWSSMPSSQTTFHLWASMDALVASSSLGLCWTSLKVGSCLQEGWCSWTLESQLWERWWWGLPLERLLPSQCHLECSPGMRCPPAWRDLSACRVEVWVQPQGLVFWGSSSLTCNQMCLTLPKTGDSLPPWSCWPLSSFRRVVLGGWLLG